MGIILVIIVLVILFWPSGPIGQTTAALTPTKKACPPHKWNYVVIEGEEGDRIKCDICHKRPGELS